MTASDFDAGAMRYLWAARRADCVAGRTADFDGTAYHYLCDDEGDFDGGAAARLGHMLFIEYPAAEWWRIRDMVLFPRCVKILEQVEGIEHEEAVARASRIAIRATFHAQDIADVQAEIDAMHAGIPCMRKVGTRGADDLDALLARELVR